MKLRLAITVAATMTIAFPTAALAKGASEATISGPGLDGGAIHLTGGGGDPASGSPLGELTEYAGYFPATFGQVPDPMLRHKPRGSLGPRYLIVWTVPGPSGDTAKLHQDLYPYAQPTALTYMRPGQPFFGGQRTHGGWYTAPAALTSTLVDAGLPVRPPRQDSGNGSTLAWGLGGAGAALSLLFATYMVLRGRPRLAGA
ncbi:MAG TPA: hypothetical protein VE688_00200 [Gaiellaceae bacterium]|jgi:hypothetical protein|nr:hypothetical protein [Gaiellaceae bacterium]